ncbi:AAA family ATPase [Clostridium sp.]|uniref:ATP-binding protein n=1 Tax=Clostridium sp. TaxID=1506 RepID=UPI00261DF1B5|nr:AAA family ATPase [Clostridium sp.]
MIEFDRDIYKKISEWKNGYNKNKVLFIEGARQIGKTHVIDNFVKNNFTKIIKINLMTDDKDVLKLIDEQIINERLSGKLNRDEVNFNHELFKRFSPSFEDCDDLVIVIDEIQEDHKMFNRIRQFAREFKSKFIVTGSYLGLTIMREEFKQSAGDTVTIEMTPMTFEEFIKACGKHELYMSLDLYGKSNKEDYEEINKYFNDYLKVGGYPESVDHYLQTGKVDEAYYKALLETILTESQKYFNLDSIQGTLVDYNSLESCIYGITRLLLKEKKGLEKGNYIAELKKIMKENNIKITEGNWNLAMAWIDRAGLINDCCKVVDFKFDEKTFNQRFYFNDVGISNYLFEFYNENKNNSSEIKGLVNETFIFNELRKISKPNFGIYKKGELDFVYFDKQTSLLYGIEVKAGKNSGATITDALQDGKIDRALYCKGNTYGEVDGKKITIPIYLFPRFKFEDSKDI